MMLSIIHYSSLCPSVLFLPYLPSLSSFSLPFALLAVSPFVNNLVVSLSRWAASSDPSSTLVHRLSHLTPGVLVLLTPSSFPGSLIADTSLVSF